MLRHPGLFYLLPFALPLLALAAPARPPAGFHASGRAMSRPMPKRQAVRRPGASVPLQVDIIVTGSDGTQYRLRIDPVTAPPPPPDPLSLTGLQLSTSSVVSGQSAVGRVTLNRAPEVPVQIGLKADGGLVVPPTVTVNVNQTTATFAIGTPFAAAPFWASVVASYGGQSQAASIFVVSAPPPPAAIRGYTDPGGQPLPAGGSWVGSPVVITGNGFGNQVGGSSTLPQGAVTWRGIDLSTYMWSDTQIGVTLSYGTVGSGTAPLVVTRFDGTAIAGPPLTVLTGAVAPAIRHLGAVGTTGQVIGEGFGPGPGSLFVHGYPTSPLSWSDTIVTWDMSVDAMRGKADEAGIRRSDGAYASLFAGDDLIPTPPAGSRARMSR